MPRRVPAKGALRRVVDPRRLVPVRPALRWALAVPGGLRPWPGAEVWNSGHVTAILPWGGDELLIGSHTGGVWRLHRESGSSNWSAKALSDDWDNPDVFSMCLAGDAPDHVYAGCFVRSFTDVVLYESLPGTGGASWQPVAVDPLGASAFGRVYAIGVSHGRLVCATSEALWWSPLPRPDAPSNARSYRWEAAVWPTGADPGGISGLAFGPDGEVVVSALSGGSIWTGRWDERLVGRPPRLTRVADLTMTAAAAPAVSDVARSSLASCAADPARMYAVVGHNSSSTDDLNQTLAAVMTSSDSGRTWALVNGRLDRSGGVALSPDESLIENHTESGDQVDWNNCIAVSSRAEGTVVIGWQRAFFVSTNATATDGTARWNRVADVNVAGVHKDVHVLWFDARADDRLFVGSDGGLLSTDDLGATVDTEYNRNLPDLQFESTPEWEFYGLTSASATVAGVIGGGLQDNGVVWATVGGHWEEVLGGDGAGTVFLADGALLAGTLGAERDAAHFWRWNGQGFVDKAIPPRLGPFGPERPTDPAGLRDPALAPVPASAFLRPDQRMWAVGGNGQEPNVVWGLFGARETTDRIWQRVCTLPDDMSLWAFATADGTEIFAGGYRTAGGRTAALFRIDAASGQFTALPAPPGLVDGVSDAGDGPAILRLCLHPDGSLLAMYGTNTSGQLLRLDATRTVWTRLSGTGGLPSERVYGVDVDSLGNIYASTDARVYLSDDDAASWWDVSTGLPRRAHLGHVVFVRHASGGIGLYLSTFGRSVWRARWPSTPLPPSARQPAWGWNQLVGSLADGRLFEHGPNGWHPVGPGPGDPALVRRGAAEFAALVRAANELGAVEIDSTATDDTLAAAAVQGVVDEIAQATSVLVRRSTERRDGAPVAAASAAIERGVRDLATLTGRSRFDTAVTAHLTDATAALRQRTAALATLTERAVER